MSRKANMTMHVIAILTDGTVRQLTTEDIAAARQRFEDERDQPDVLVVHLLRPERIGEWALARTSI